MPFVEEEFFDIVLDEIAQAMKRQEDAKCDRGIKNEVFLAALDRDEVLRRTFDQAEGQQQDDADHPID